MSANRISSNDKVSLQTCNINVALSSLRQGATMAAKRPRSTDDGPNPIQGHNWLTDLRSTALYIQKQELKGVPRSDRMLPICFYGCGLEFKNATALLKHLELSCEECDPPCHFSTRQGREVHDIIVHNKRE